jgi:thiamine-phosphate pyrophosphorylase
VKPLSSCQLYAFIDTGFLRGRTPSALAQELCSGGADIIQLRAKGACAVEVRRLVEAILPVTRAAGVPLVVNDHFAVAQALGTEYSHLGQEDFFDAGYLRVSELAPAGSPRVGLSSHAPDQAQRALAAGAAYLGVGPVFPTGTKPEAAPVTLDYVRWAAANVKIPWFPIGGINLANLDQVLAAGAKGVCVVSAILNAPDVAAECRKYKQRLQAR